MNGVRPEKAMPRRTPRGDYAVAALFVLILTLVFLWWSESVTHWFVLPVMACGVLAGADVVRWLRGRLDLFDPRTIVACLAFYGFFIAPFLNVIWDQYGIGDMVISGDWRLWLGAMASLNALGLVAYRIADNFIFRRANPSRSRWEINRKRFYPIFAFVLVISAGGVLAYLWQLGGIVGEVHAFESNQEAFVGKGWMLVLAWPLAVLSFLAVVVTLTDTRTYGKHRLTVGILLLSLAGIGHFLLMGWYGSRSATIWALFWMAGIVHYRFRKLPPKVTALGLLLLVTFMYFYGFYKEQKRSGLEVLRSPSMWLEPKGYQRDIKYLLLGDLARSDSNAYILHNLVKDPGEYDFRWGLTYVGAFGILIPRNFWPTRPSFKVDAGTEAQFGKGAQYDSTRVYGLSGEALLNFGPWGVVPMFAFYGGLLGWYRKKLRSWNPEDARLLLAPFFTIMFLTGFVYDSDNVVYFSLTEGALICVAVYAASNRFSRNAPMGTVESSTDS
jgi:hypothetical protein